MSTINYEEIDEPIREIVKALNASHFITEASCQGGEGHAFKLPTIVFTDKTTLHQSLLRTFLYQRGFEGFTISEHSLYQKGPLSFKDYLSLEFWSLDQLKGFVA